jgi:hypothetical protein
MVAAMGLHTVVGSTPWRQKRSQRAISATAHHETEESESRRLAHIFFTTHLFSNSCEEFLAFKSVPPRNC